jgi:hypothetical protein
MLLLWVPRSPLLLSSILFAERVVPLTTSLSRLPLVWRKCFDLRLAKLCGKGGVKNQTDYVGVNSWNVRLKGRKVGPSWKAISSKTETKEVNSLTRFWN